MIDAETAPWGRAPARRRKGMFALALVLHALLLLAMLHARLQRTDPDEPAVAGATIWLSSPPVPSRLPPRPAAVSRPTRLRSIAHAGAEARAIHAPLLQPRLIAQAASAPAPEASAAWAPLDLTLTRDQLRAVIADTKPTLGQMLARPPAPSALASLGGDDAPYVERPLAGGETAVQVHGGCFRMVPTPRSQYDPFNHGGERLTAACR